MQEMRRDVQALDMKTCREMLEHAGYGVLATSGSDGYPYAIPMSFAYAGAGDSDAPGAIYMHSATEGHKIGAMGAEERVSFCVVDQSKPVPEELTDYFRSVICFGRAKVATDEVSVREGLEALGRKYSSGHEDLVNEHIEKAIGHVAVIRIDLDYITGKQAVELVHAK